MGRPSIPTREGYAWCGYHQTEHLVTEFSKESRRWNGLRSICKEAVNAYNVKYAQEHPGFWRKGRYEKLYGITRQDYEDMLAEQGGRCAICNKGHGPGCRDLFVDHDHETGAVRGLLCAICNQFLGRINDDPKRLVDYLLYN